MVAQRGLVVELRAVWRCVAYDDGVVGSEQVLDVSAVLDASIAKLLAGKHDGVAARWGNDGAWWSCLVRNKERKTAN